MTDADLTKLTAAAIQLNRVMEMLSEDPDVPESMLALLTAASGCFTALVYKGEWISEIHTAVLFTKLTKKDKELMQ